MCVGYVALANALTMMMTEAICLPVKAAKYVTVRLQRTPAVLRRSNDVQCCAGGQSVELYILDEVGVPEAHASVKPLDIGEANGTNATREAIHLDKSPM